MRWGFWFRVLIIPTIVVPLTITFSLSNKHKEVLYGLDRLTLVIDHEKKEITDIAPVIFMEENSGDDRKQKKEKEKTEDKSKSKDEKQDESKDKQDMNNNTGENTNEEGDGEGTGDEGNRSYGDSINEEGISYEDIAKSAIDIITRQSSNLIFNKDIISAFEVMSSIERLSNALDKLQNKNKS